MKKITIVLVLLALIIFAGLKGGLWYFTKQFVDNKITQAKVFAQISYKNIDTSLTGKATVKGVNVFIPLLDDNIFIESVQLVTPDMFTLFSLPKKLEQQQFPESLSLAVIGLQIDLNGNLMKILDNQEIPPGPSEIIATLGCGEVFRIGSKALSKMGYDAIIMDSILRYDYNAKNKQLNFHLSDNLRDMTRFTIEGEISNVEDITSLVSTSPQAKLGKITLETVDDSFLERKNRFCANENNSSVADYIDKNTRLLQEYLESFGIELGDGLVSAYQQAFINPGTFTLTADLSELNGLEEINTFYPNDLIQFIRLKMFLDDTRIDEISVYIDKDKLLDVITQDPQDRVLNLPEPPEKPKQPQIREYHPTTISELTKYNGYPVKVYTRRGKIYRGKINTSNKKVYEVIVRLRSGNISYHVPIGQIHKAEVFY